VAREVKDLTIDELVGDLLDRLDRHAHARTVPREDLSSRSQDS
jgi:hypothetical protein